MKLGFWPFNKKTIEKRRSSARAYAAAQFNRLVSDWIAASTSADEEIRASLPRLRARARQLGRDNDWVRGILREFETNVIGRGIGLQMQVQQQRGGKLNDALNAEIERLFWRWTRKDSCDVAGILRFQDMEQLAVRNWAESGEIFIRKIYQKFGRSKVPIALEVIESDMLDDGYSTVLENGNRIKMGVELDKWSRPVAYHFFVEHPGEHSFAANIDRRGVKRVRIPADEVIHLFRPERPNQTRGVPILVSAMIRLRQMHGYEEAEVIFARASASLMGFIESDADQLPGDGELGEQQVIDFEPGVFKQLRPGESVNIPAVSRPGGQFDPFMRSQLRGVSAGTGPAYTSVSADYSQSNYSSERAAILKERDYWRVLQDWVIANFHQPVFEAWLSMAYLSEALALPRYDVAPESYEEATKWCPRGWAWIDPEKEVNAYERGVQAGFITQSEVIAQDGGDFHEKMAQRAMEVEKAKSLKLTFSSDYANSQAMLGFRAAEASAKKQGGQQGSQDVTE